MNEMEKARAKLEKIKREDLDAFAFYSGVSIGTLKNIAAGKGAQYASVRKILDCSVKMRKP
jgi:hypothetical protein